MADAKKMVEGWVFGDGAVIYPSLYDVEGKKVRVGAYAIGFARWEPDGTFKWFELGGTQGRHVHRTHAARVEIEHSLGVWLYDLEGRETAYLAPACEEWDGDDLDVMRAQLQERDRAMQDEHTLKRFLDFFDNE